MIETKLIIVTGMSGTGKSTTARYISDLLNENNIKHTYLHEECENHPIRSDEFKIGSLKRKEDLQLNIAHMFKLWNDLSRQILTSDQVYVLEGCLYDNIIRYFYDSVADDEDVYKFYRDLNILLKPLNPVVIFMHTDDVKKTLNHVYPIRGNWWKELILDDNVEYMIKNDLKGEEGAYQMWIDYQALAEKAFEQRQGLKLCLETSKQEWTKIRKNIADYLRLAYFDQIDLPVLNGFDYVGSYGLKEDIDFYVKTKDKELYVHAFWPYMALNQIEQDVFMFKAFPIKLSFVRNERNEVYAVDVTGDYDWDIMGKRLKRMTNSVK